MAIKVHQYSPNGTFVAEYPSINRAAQAVGVSTSAIKTSVESGGRRGAGGFRWVYAGDTPKQSTPTENWVPVCHPMITLPNGQSKYEVSPTGKVRSVLVIQTSTSRLLRQTDGFVTLSDDNQKLRCPVDILVAQAFVPNPHGLGYVKHLDGDVTNNNASNLMWVSSRLEALMDEKSLRTPINKYDVAGRFLTSYDCAAIAEQVTGVPVASIIACCKREERYASTAGVVWRFSTDPDQNVPSAKSAVTRPVMQFTKDGKLLRTYSSAQEASRETKLLVDSIRSCCSGRTKSAGGYVFKYMTWNYDKGRV